MKINLKQVFNIVGESKDFDYEIAADELQRYKRLFSLLRLSVSTEKSITGQVWSILTIPLFLGFFTPVTDV